MTGESNSESLDWAAFTEQVKDALGLARGEKVVVGLALGYEDPGMAVN